MAAAVLGAEMALLPHALEPAYKFDRSSEVRIERVVPRSLESKINLSGGSGLGEPFSYSTK